MKKGVGVSKSVWNQNQHEAPRTQGLEQNGINDKAFESSAATKRTLRVSVISGSEERFLLESPDADGGKCSLMLESFIACATTNQQRTYTA